MPELAFLKDLVVILAAAIAVVALLRRIGVPPIAGFIVAGALIGPNALSLISDPHQVEVLAEVGVVLLLFGIGLELSLERLRRLWKAVVIGGMLQVGLTVLAVTGIAVAYGMRIGSAFFLGCVVAISSTAIVLRGLAERGELDAPHGRLALGILVFQDLCVVPMILIIPFLAGTGGSTTDALWTLFLAMVVLAGVLVAARIIAPGFLDLISRTRRRDLFVLAVFFICLGTAWAVSLAGISLALGAFLAGLVVAGSEYRHQALSDLVPLREVLASIFFVSIGMLLDIGDVLEHLAPILGLLALIVIGKFVLIFLTAALMRLPLRVCVLTAAALSQIGEFSFVLWKATGDTGILSAGLSHNLIVAVILSMLVTPLFIALGPHLAQSAHRVSWLTRLLLDRETPHVPDVLKDHVIVAGYGVAGQAVAEALKSCDVRHVVVDLNPDSVRRASAEGEPVYYGDVTSPEVLEELGIVHARQLVVAVNDPQAAERAVRTVRSLAPDVPILVRTQFVLDIEPMRRAGATEVIAAEQEAAQQLKQSVLLRCGLTALEISRRSAPTEGDQAG